MLVLILLKAVKATHQLFKKEMLHLFGEQVIWICICKLWFNPDTLVSWASSALYVLISICPSVNIPSSLATWTLSILCDCIWLHCHFILIIKVESLCWYRQYFRTWWCPSHPNVTKWPALYLCCVHVNGNLKNFTFFLIIKPIDSKFLSPQPYVHKYTLVLRVFAVCQKQHSFVIWDAFIENL